MEFNSTVDKDTVKRSMKALRKIQMPTKTESENPRNEVAFFCPVKDT